MAATKIIKTAQLERLIDDAKADVAAALAVLTGAKEVAVVVDDPRAWGPFSDPLEDLRRAELVASANGKPLVATYPLAEAVRMLRPTSQSVPEVAAEAGQIPVIYMHGDDFTVIQAKPGGTDFPKGPLAAPLPRKIDTPARQAAWRALLAWLSPEADLGFMRGDIDSQRECVVVEVSSRMLAMKIDLVDAVATRVPPAAAAELRRRAASGRIAFVLADQDAQELLFIDAVIKGFVKEEGGDA